jgi:hypothetical protein
MRLTLSTLPGALFRPDRVFAGQQLYKLPKLLLVVLLFLVYVTGERIVQGSYQNAHAKTLAILEVDSRMSGLMQNAPTQVQNQARGQMLDSILGKQSGFLTSVSIAFSGVGFLLTLLEAWVVSTIGAQFFGGQEERRGRDRLSWTMFLIAFIPLALRKLCAGVLTTLRNPDAAANALTLADYRSLAEVKLDLYSLLGPLGIPPFFASIAKMLTDPFFLWTLAILWFGGKEVYRVKLSGAVLLSFLIVIVLSLQAALFARIGLSWEI